MSETAKRRGPWSKCSYCDAEGPECHTTSGEIYGQNRWGSQDSTLVLHPDIASGLVSSDAQIVHDQNGKPQCEDCAAWDEECGCGCAEPGVGHGWSDEVTT